MALSTAERQVLLQLCLDSDGLLRTKARPSLIVKRLAEIHAIANVLTTTLSSPGRGGGTSIWKITPIGRALIEGAKTDANEPT